MDDALYQQTVDISVEFGVITTAPGDDAFRTDLASEALEGISEDTTGSSYTKQTVEVTPGGE